MKTFYRFLEPDALISLSETFAQKMQDSEVTPKEGLALFLDGLKGAFISSMVEQGFELPEGPLSMTQLCSSVGGPDEADSYELKSYIVGLQLALARAAVMETLINTGEFEEAIVYSMGVAELAIRKHPVEPGKKIDWIKFDAISGDYPEVENMVPSSTAGQLELVLKKGRELWGGAETLPDWKLQQARRLQEIESHVFQYSNRYGNEWIDEEYRTDEAPLYFLDCQIDKSHVMRHVKAAYSPFGKFDERIKVREVYALYAVINAYRGLDELWDQEYSECNEVDDRWPRKYLAEAEGFLRVALEESSLNRHQSKAAKARSKWKEDVESMVKSRVDLLESKRSARSIAELLLDGAKKRREEAGGGIWSNDYTAVSELAKVVRKLRKSK